MALVSQTLVAVLCLALVTSLAMCVPNRVPYDEVELIDSDFAKGRDCPPGEYTVMGQLPECEPTCENQRPICPKIFIPDSVLCFCRQPLVRDTRTKQCVPTAQCTQRRKASN